MSGSPNLGSISTRLRRIAHLAREDRQRSFLSLAHYVDEFWLMEAYSRTRKDGATGVDGQTAKQYEENLEENLRSLARPLQVGSLQGASGSAGRDSERQWVVRPGRSGSLPSRTRCCSVQWRWCWRRSTRRTSWTARMAFGPVARRTMRSRAYSTRRSWGWGEDGC